MIDFIKKNQIVFNTKKSVLEALQHDKNYHFRIHNNMTYIFFGDLDNYDKDISDYKEIVYEGYAMHGIAVLVETATNNHVRTVANVRSYFNKCGGTFGTTGSVAFMFDHNCTFKIKKDGLDAEELELELIDFGAEEVFVEEDGILIYGPFESFGAIQGELEKRGIEIITSGFERIPNVTKELTAEQEEDVNKLIEKIEEDDDVQNVYSNFDVSVQ